MKSKIIISFCLLFTTLNANNFKKSVTSTQYTNESLRQAFKAHHKLAKKGNVPSQYALGLMFHYGSGVRQNAELAKLWFRRASRKGHPKARSILARFYLEERPLYVARKGAKYGMISNR
ncbi:MAG: Unknown protein [uncultured Sulfurovum sp.]|uniref:beta-lactamase n=1 Tax=uncultured Sulfurovum sp. TaxID=269237 RepID=A0A6S6S354_9BACT|nr:MAG: Unknown protein [uncultured Sulfurovum sp.]